MAVGNAGYSLHAREIALGGQERFNKGYVLVAQRLEPLQIEVARDLDAAVRTGEFGNVHLLTAGRAASDDSVVVHVFHLSPI